MPQEVANGDDLGPVLQQIRGKGMPQAMTTRGDPGRLGVAVHLLLDGFDGEGILRAFAVPKDIALGPRPWMLPQILLDTGYGIGRHIHAAIFVSFALHWCSRAGCPGPDRWPPSVRGSLRSRGTLTAASTKT